MNLKSLFLLPILFLLSSPSFASQEIAKSLGLRSCATLDREVRQIYYPQLFVDNSNCSQFKTKPSDEYTGPEIFRVPVVVHVIMNKEGTKGALTDEEIQSQIDILNEDFRAMMGTNGEKGFDIQIEFFLATLDPKGDPTNGITRSHNNTWFNDSGSYWEDLAWDPNQYMNVYTNSAKGYLGYVPFLPADSNGIHVGTSKDRVVVLLDAFGRDGRRGPPYDQGRTLTHEVGHYLGLEHTFNGSCSNASKPDCYSKGDLICDTASASSSNFGCPIGKESCGSKDPIHNYMDYTDDLCMQTFTF